MPEIITLCGSTRFKKAFEDTEKALTLKGKIVLTVGFFEKVDGFELSNEDLSILNDLHREKILLSDSIFVINQEGYIGEQTRDEIEFAISNGKNIVYLEDSNEPYKR